MKINMKIEDKDIKRVVPPLRFPEFRDAEGWGVTTLKSICKITNGKCNAQDHIEGGIYPLFDRSETRKASNSYLFDCEAVIIPGEGMRFTPKYYIGKFNLHQRAYALKDFSCIGLYIYYLMEHRSDLLSINAVKSTVLSLRLPILQDFPIETPKNLREQKKIADCLSSLDDLINAVTDKIEALKEYKKGLMQQLFPAEGKTTPTLRFTEFQNAGEWESKTLSDVCKLVRGPFGGALKKEIFVESGYAVYEQSHAIYENTSTFRYYITKDKFNELIRFAVRPNDIIMSCSGTMGKFSIIPENYIEGVINQALLKLSTKKDNDYRFIKYVLELPNNQKQLLSDAAGGAIKNVASVSQIKEMPLLIPNLKEQQQIANCLSSVDILISSEIDKLDQLKTHKKGLMQQLFPTINK